MTAAIPGEHLEKLDRIAVGAQRAVIDRGGHPNRVAWWAGYRSALVDLATNPTPSAPSAAGGATHQFHREGYLQALDDANGKRN
ncbi:hypothetical protein [Mycolicibacterium sphagni]|uniref:hypothetical protein n=1 Tax=Mycolicibacterium sphagni TaxID=1786 RepID=UPI0021F3BB6D|nr:hypothetical protein [Mycolicibacterium sphagni]MCV7174768.1 hypothetical protein [Mycolicibacterium sphagni]